MRQPLITVYITNYNYGQFIKEAIQSVLTQKDVSFELLIIDDGSKDNSKQIIEQYRSDERITIIYQQNKGLNITNNIALHLANGKYIMRLDADDYLAKDALKKLSQPLEENDNLGLVFPDYYIVESNGDLIEHHQRHDFKKEVSLYDQAAHGACTMIRVEFLKSLGGYNENYKCQDGYELWIKFVNKYKVVNVPEPLFYYRQHGSNLTSNENRILGTRAKINADYVERLNINNQALGIIPIRNKKDKYYQLKINDKTLLDIKIEQALKSHSLKQVIVTCPDNSIRETINKDLQLHSKFQFHERPEVLTRINTSLDGTVNSIIESIKPTLKSDLSAVIIMDIRFPLISSVKIDDAVNTMLLFKADSIISVRTENGMFYKHDGSGMKPILTQAGTSKLERNVVYKHVGGLTGCNYTSFVNSKKIINGKVGHMVLDKNSAYLVETKQDLAIIEQINLLHNII